MTPTVLAALHADSFTTPRPFTAAEFAELLVSPGCFLCTRTRSFALGRAVAGEAELLTLAVAPELRRRGLGRQILAAFETEAQARGATTAYLEVAANNAPARTLYVAAGYIETGRRPGYYRDVDGARIDAVIMQNTLTPD